MAQVEVARGASEDLDRLIKTLSLSRDTPDRVKRSLQPLARFPRLGPELTGRWAGFRFILGPWRWLLIVYAFLEEDERVVVVNMQDARSSLSPTASVG